MTTLAEQIEALRLQIAGHTSSDTDLVRSLRASLEHTDATLAAELAATIEGHKHRRWALAEQLALLAQHLGSFPRLPAAPPPVPLDQQPLRRIGS
jgi:hypothetical protein